MSEADEMFEKLGYIKTYEKEEGSPLKTLIVAYESKKNEPPISFYSFHHDKKIQVYRMNMETLQAIYKKCEEMRMDIEEAKDWLASIDVHSEAEASYKELILSTLEALSKELKSEINRYKGNEEFYIKELKKKDKIIDLMAGEISNSILNTCPYADYNKNLNCERRCSDDDNLLVKCWKKHFEEEVEDE